MFIEALKNVNVDRLDLDEVIALLAVATVMEGSYKHFAMETPVWLTDTITTLTNDAKSRQRDNMLRARKEVERELESLKTAAEKRKDLQERLSRINAALS